MNLLLLHGALGSQGQMDLVVECMPTQNVRRLEFRGHGERDIPEEGLSFDGFLRDIDEALDREGWDRAHMFGYSMGGYAALLMAARHPDRVESVVTLGTKLLWDREGLDRELRLLDPQRMKEKVPHFAMHLLTMHGADRWESLVRHTAKLVTGLYENPLLPEEVLRRIHCPVLLCTGDRDRTAVADHTLVAARQLSHGAALILPGTQHLLEEMDLNVLIPHLRAFWGLELND